MAGDGDHGEAPGVVPWTPRTPQQEGIRVEKEELRKRGIRPHPGSGSGNIRYDGHDDESIIEVKNAKKSYTMNHRYLRTLMDHAIRQNKTARFEVHFPGFTAYVVLLPTRSNGAV